MSQQMTVLEFLEETKELPKTISVERSQNSKYPFFLLVRHYRKRLSRIPTFLTYEKKTMDATKSMMEEHSIFDDTPLYILEGFNQTFVDSLALPEKTYVVAETEGGTLKADTYSYRIRREILRVLINQLNLKLSLRSLLSLDWSSCRDYADIEILLRKARLMSWTEEELGEHLRQMETGQLLTLLKRSQTQDLYHMVDKYGPSWTYGHLIELLYQLIHYKALRAMGYEDDRTAKELEVGYGRIKELADTAIMLSNADIKKMVQRLVKFDGLMQRRPELGLDLILLNAPLRVKK